MQFKTKRKGVRILTPVLAIFLAFTFLGANKNCPLTGQATDAQTKKLNWLMNRASLPTDREIDKEISLESLLNSKDSAGLFSDRYAATVEGFVYSFEEGKAASCNCFSNDKMNWDYILYLSKDGKAKELSDCALVSITPASRRLHPNWTPEYLKSLKGKQIKVTGWMLYNFPETRLSYESHPNALKLERHTAWEIHPVTDMKIDE